MVGRTNHLEPHRPWQGRRVLLGVCGGIAAYKSVQVARDLTRLGAEVDVVLTRSAEEFVRPLTFQGVTGRPVHTSMFAADRAALHIELGEVADAICVAPATADFLARAAHGRANELLGAALLVTRAPVVLCPAMNSAMWDHPQTQRNVAHVQDELGYSVAGPGRGPLAAGEASGVGRMLEAEEIVAHVGRALTGASALRGSTVLVTAGPTHEPLDPVRYLGNRSSGKMGYALAAAAWQRGAQVVLVSGPSTLPDPVGVEVVRIETAEEMLQEATRAAERADVLIFAAAVADYRPSERAERKLKRSGVGLTIHTVENPDIAEQVHLRRGPDSVAVGFALETDNLVDNAKQKLLAKGFDLIVANPADDPAAGMDVDTNRATLLFADGSSEDIPLMSKANLAQIILDRAEQVRIRTASR